MVQPDQILEVITLTHEPQEACELLIAEANDNGGTDNISALLVRVDEALPDHEVVEDAELEIEAEVDHEVVDEHEIYAEIEHEPEPVIPAAARLPEPIFPLARAPEPVIPAAARAPEIEVASEPEEVDEPPESAPTVQVAVAVEVAELPLLDDRQIAELVAAFARGDDIDLDLHGPWVARLAVRHCGQCAHELYPGNRFCTECGARIEAVTA
jgi:protein phosphatase